MAKRRVIAKERAQGMACAFCKGTGKDPFGLLSPLSTCQVCGGEGRVAVEAPASKCAFCGGTGIHSDTRLTCTVCRGKGSVTITKGGKPCPTCDGRGHATPGLPCLTCAGKGVAA